MTITFTPTVTPALPHRHTDIPRSHTVVDVPGSTYTPTPLYVMTQHPVISRSAFEAGMHFLAAKDYPTARVQFQQVITLEPDAADLYYYIGESYRVQGDYRSARDAYQEAIDRDSAFAPAFLGRARANLGLDPECGNHQRPERSH